MVYPVGIFENKLLDFTENIMKSKWVPSSYFELQNGNSTLCHERFTF